MLLVAALAAASNLGHPPIWAEFWTPTHWAPAPRDALTPYEPPDTALEHRPPLPHLGHIRPACTNEGAGTQAQELA
jgi:hypothetical protein